MTWYLQARTFRRGVVKVITRLARTFLKAARPISCALHIFLGIQAIPKSHQRETFGSQDTALNRLSPAAVLTLLDRA